MLEHASVVRPNWLKNRLWAQGNSVCHSGSRKSDLIVTETVNYLWLCIRKFVVGFLVHGIFCMNKQRHSLFVCSEFVKLLNHFVEPFMHEFHIQTLPDLRGVKLRNSNTQNLKK